MQMQMSRRRSCYNIKSLNNVMLHTWKGSFVKVRSSESLIRAFVILLEPENGDSSAFAWIIMSSIVTDGTDFWVSPCSANVRKGLKSSPYSFNM